MTTPEFRIIIRRADWPRGRTFLGTLSGVVAVQAPGAPRQTVPLFTRSEAVRLIPKLRALMPADTSIYLKAEGKH